MRDVAFKPTRPAVFAAVWAALVLGIVLEQSPRALLVLVTDGAVAAGILLAAALGGLWLVTVLRLGRAPMRWQLLLGAGLGIGGLSLLALGLGLLGLLNRTLWIVLLTIMGASGLLRLVMLKANAGNLRSEISDSRPSNSTLETRNSKLASLWLLVTPFAALALLNATVPPGLLWAEEGNGYDALEYHLQMPREYMEAGRITHAPHNVYANFPSNAEMLYLVGMIVQGDAIDGAMVAQVLNAWLAFLTVAAAWLAGREFLPGAGHVAGVLAGTCGWLVYLSGVAFVETAMLFFGVLAAAVLARVGCAMRTTSGYRNGAHSAPYEWLAVAGALAGLSAGCKYTAVVLVTVPLGLAVLVLRHETHRRRIVSFVLFSVSAFAAFAPWMLKNASFTGNPVFPLAHQVFRSYPEGWSAEAAEHFAVCHAPADGESSIAFRLKALWTKVLADPDQRFGPGIWLLAGAGIMAVSRGGAGDGNPQSRYRDPAPRSAPSRAGRNLGPAIAPWLLVVLVQFAVWLGWTHLYARFAVVFLIPLTVMGGAVFDRGGARARTFLAVILVGGAAWNLWFGVRLHREHLYAGGQRIGVEGAVGVFIGGLVPGFEHLQIINRGLPDDAKVLLVGEARAFYLQRGVDYRVVFNTDPFVELLQTKPGPGEVRAWLQKRGFTHVYFAWTEVRRLARSRYGFHGMEENQLRHSLESLVTAGVLRRSHQFSASGRGAPYGELYEVVPPE